jgi:hypothetical protein
MPKKVYLLSATTVRSVQVVGNEGSRSRKAIAFISNRFSSVANGNDASQVLSQRTTSLLEQIKPETEQTVPNFQNR